MDMSSRTRISRGTDREVLEKFHPVDGIFFDMCWNQPSVSNWAKAGMAKAGLNPDIEADRDEYARRVALDYVRELYRLSGSIARPRRAISTPGRCTCSRRICLT